MQLPTYDEAEAAIEYGTATPIETFIYDNELDRPHDRLFRRQLLDAINFAAREGTIYTEI